MRLTGAATKVFKSQGYITDSVPIPHSVAPIFFRTSHEIYFDALPSWKDSIDVDTELTNVTGHGGTGEPRCTISQEASHTGMYSLKFSGRDMSTSESYAYYQVFDVNIPITDSTFFSFWHYPTSNTGRYVSLDLVMTDKSTLRNSEAKDINGISMHPSVPRGTSQQWTPFICQIGKWFSGKTIDRILIGYDHSLNTWDFITYFDDIAIYNTNNVTTKIPYFNHAENNVMVYPNPSPLGYINLDVSASFSEIMYVQITDITGKIYYSAQMSPNNTTISTAGFPKGLYVLSVTYNETTIRNKIILN
jgi:hypothetical protein